MHDIERELIKATNYKPMRKFSDRQDYLKSILNAVSKLTDDDYESLSDEAATWANSAVEAHNAKNDELPDFDEITLDEETNGTDSDEGDVPSDTSEGTTVVAASSVPEERSEEDSVAEEAPKPKKSKAPKSTAKPKSELKHGHLPDVVVDKWGAMEGSKNARALAMFEKGATTKEVKDAIGGTYYNILSKMVTHGHKVEKEGAIIRLTHKTDIGGKAKKKK